MSDGSSGGASGGASGGGATGERLRLHIGGEEVREGWKILNIQAKPGVDYLGTADDLSQFADDSVTEIYASHVYEHLKYMGQLRRALKEAYRVLVPGGTLRAGVPDLEVLCKLLLHPQLNTDQKFHVQRMMFGGQIDDYDIHYVGLTFEFFRNYLMGVGFKSVTRVKSFGLFNDTSDYSFAGVPISLNVVATK